MFGAALQDATENLSDSDFIRVVIDLGFFNYQYCCTSAENRAYDTAGHTGPR